jgi:rod shape-determining protein MreC
MFLNKKSSKEENKSWISSLLAFVLSILLLFLSSIGWLNWAKDSISFVLDPIYTTSSSWSRNIKEFSNTLFNISDFRHQYNQMKIDIAQLEINNLAYTELKNENNDLKKQLELKDSSDTYIQAKVLDHIESDYLLVNVGLQDDVRKGDIAVLGEAFVGIVVETGQYNSKIRLPISKSSFLEAYILPSNSGSSQKILSRAVVSGSSDGIRIENIGMNSGVENGDIVIVNDEKVGDNLVLGTVVGLSEDPATTTRTGYVSPAIDYFDLINIFLRVKNAD